MERKRKPPRRGKDKQIGFRVTRETYERLQRVASAQHRDTVPDLMYAKALEMAEATEAAR